MKILWVIAGPNGSGKTTLTSAYLKKNIPIINPDTIAQKLFPNSFNEPKAVISAGRNALRERNAMLLQNSSFAIETTLSGRQEIEFIKEAKRNGFLIYLIYVGTSSFNISIGRIKQREATGGHSVAIPDIKRRYERSMANLNIATTLADKSIIINNDEYPKLVAVISHGLITAQSRNTPIWVEKHINF